MRGIEAVIRLRWASQAGVLYREESVLKEWDERKQLYQREAQVSSGPMRLMRGYSWGNWLEPSRSICGETGTVVLWIVRQTGQ